MAVYFARAGADGPWVKIGTAAHPEDRVRALDTGSPFPLVLMRVIDGSDAVERWLHRHFAAHRLKGEWFNFVPEMLTIEPPVLVEAASWRDWSLIEQLAEAAGIHVETRRQWLKRGRVAYRWHLPFISAAEAQGKVLTRNSFFAPSHRSAA